MAIYVYHKDKYILIQINADSAWKDDQLHTQIFK